MKTMDVLYLCLEVAGELSEGADGRAVYVLLSALYDIDQITNETLEFIRDRISESDESIDDTLINLMDADEEELPK